MPKQARVLVVGGGVAAAHVAQALCDRKEELPEAPDKPLCVILSSYPSGIAPYDRSRISKDALDCTKLDATSFPSLELPDGWNYIVARSSRGATTRNASRSAMPSRVMNDMTYEAHYRDGGARQIAG